MRRAEGRKGSLKPWTGMALVKNLVLSLLLLAAAFAAAAPAAAQSGEENPWYRVDAKGEVVPG